MERSRFRTLLGIGLIVLGVIFLGQALPPLPPLPALPPLPPPAPPALPFLHHGAWFSPPVLLIGLVVLVLMWRRGAVCAPPK